MTSRLIAERIERLISVGSTLDDLDESARFVRLAAGARLTPDRIAFLQDALAELPTMAADRVDRRRSALTGPRRATS